jgi:hypothetical protein
MLKKISLLFIFIFYIFSFADVQVENSAATVEGSDILYDGGVCYVVYKSASSIYFTKSTDVNFLTWQEPIQITTMLTVGNPKITKYQNNIYVFWTGKKDASDTYKKVYYAISSNYGLSFSAPILMFPGSAETAQIDCAEVAVDNNGTSLAVGVIAANIATPTYSNVYFVSEPLTSVTTNLTGLTIANMNNITDITSADGNVLFSSLNLKHGSNATFNVVFEKYVNNVITLYYWNSTSSQNASVISNTYQDIGGNSYKSLPNLKMIGNDINVIFQDFSSGVNKIASVKSTDGGISWIYTVVEGNVNGTVNYPEFHYVSDSLYALWRELDASNNVILKYKKYDLTSWEALNYTFNTEYSVYDMAYISLTDGTDKIYYSYSGENGLKYNLFFGYSQLQNATSGTGNLPTVVGKYPAPNSTDIDVGTGIRIEFSTAMNTSTFTAANLRLYEKNTNLSVAYTIDGSLNNVALLIPSTKLKYDTEYTVSVSGVLDLNGNQVVPSQWSFKTASQNLSSAATITKAISYPNPYRGGLLKFNYSFSRPAKSVVIKIYNLKGKLIQKITPPDTTGASSEAVWDLIDRYGNRIGNGLYIYKIVADFGGETVEKTGKLIVAR